MIPVTVIEAGPCTVVQRKTARTDGYDAVQIGFRQTNDRQGRQGPMLGHFQKAGKGAFSASAEFGWKPPNRWTSADRGSRSTSSKEGDVVDVMGHSKGQGFTGVIKRWNFKGGRDDARLHVPSGARLHRRVGVPLARHQEHEDGGPVRERARHDPQPARGRGGAGEESAARPRRRAWRENSLVFVRRAVKKPA